MLLFNIIEWYNATSSIYKEINMTFETIIQEIKNKPTNVSFDEEKRATLIKVVEYIQNSDLDILHRISIQQIVDVIGRHNDKILFIGFYLCGCKWHLLDQFYQTQANIKSLISYFTLTSYINLFCVAN